MSQNKYRHYHRHPVVSIFLLYMLFTGPLLHGQGSAGTTGPGYCVDFTANLSNGNYIDLGALSAIDTGNFSVEMWVNVNDCKNDPPFFSNKDWSSGSTTGMVFDVHDNGTRLRVNLKTNSSTFQNIIVPVNAKGRGWFHFAVTLDRATFLKVYIDGEVKSTIYFPDGLAGSFASAYTYKLGQDGTGNYTDENNVPIRFDGKLDEIRIWQTERTEEDIRSNMCKKISPFSPGLYAYYRCDTLQGTVLKDMKGTHHGTWKNSSTSNWKISGAAIGDTSISAYAGSDWNGIELFLSDPSFGEMKIKNIVGVEGLHLYQINDKPALIKGLNTFSDNGVYYGVFLAGISNSSRYDALLNYTLYTTATGNESTLKLFTRNQNSDHYWSEYQAQQDLANNILTKTGVKRKKEYILGTDMGQSCKASSTVTLSDQTNSSCMVGWSGGSANNWNIAWGAQGFELGTANQVNNTASNPQNIASLSPGNFYDFYVQDTCSPGSASFWAGPFEIYSLSCFPPSNFIASDITEKSALLTWKGNGYKSDIEWGLAGFILGQGIPDSTANDTLLLQGLSANTSYAYYVKGNCPGTNNYNGPFTFKTLTKSGVEKNELNSNLLVYPNPGNGVFEILLNTTAHKQVMIQVFNAQGKQELNTMERNRNGSVKATYDLSHLSKGIYFIRVSDGTVSASRSIIIQ